jgi:hypothetical protein
LTFINSAGESADTLTNSADESAATLKK